MHGLAFDLAQRRRPVGELEQAHVLLRLQQLERVGVVAGSEQHLDELLGEPLGARPVDATVERDHAAVGALRVAREGPLVGELGARRRPRSRRGCCA